MSLSAREIDVWRGSRRILSRVSLEVRPGEFLAVIGPNGAGKSTLLGALAGVLPCPLGEVLLEGLPLSRWKPSERARQLGVLPQESSLVFGFTALEVVLLGRTPHGRGRESREEVRVALAALAETGARHLAARHAHRVAVVAHGRPVALGPPRQVLQPELIAAIFGIDVEVIEHPGSSAPLVIPTSRPTDLEPAPPSSLSDE